MHSHHFWALNSEQEVRDFQANLDLYALTCPQSEALARLARQLLGTGSLLSSAWEHTVEILAFGPREKLGTASCGADYHAMAAEASLFRYGPERGFQGAGLEVAGVAVALPGEEACGDAWDVQGDATRCAVCLVDGLGHGALAAQAAGVALAAFQQHWLAEPSR